MGLLHPNIDRPVEKPLSGYTFSIEALNGGWDQFLSIEVFHRKNRTKTPTTWPLARAGDPPRGVRLTSDHQQAVVHYVLSPEATAQLTPGEYAITAELRTEQGASKASWTGKLQAAWKILVVEKQPKVAPSAACYLALNSFEYFNVLGRPKDGLQALNDALTVAPPGFAWACLDKRASIAEQSGNLAGAKDDYCKATTDIYVGRIAEMAARKPGSLMPYYTRTTLEEHCERLTALLKK
ncbi:hypothetical protein [Myxococcus stipitatus]|uniref:hypothetical protein n=1 Tax=Myxococcus stipitatus TaxID=83455 RepID=UPI0030D20127